MFSQNNEHLHCRLLSEKARVEYPEDPSYKFLRSLNMGSKSFKRHEMDILFFDSIKGIQTLEQYVRFFIKGIPPPQNISIPTSERALPLGDRNRSVHTPLYILVWFRARVRRTTWMLFVCCVCWSIR